MELLTARGIAAVLLGLGLVAPGAAQDSYVGRPVYAEPSAGLQLPPNCSLDPTWRARVSNSELELWVVECYKVARLWLLKRSVVEMVGANQARLRFQVIEDQAMPDEVAGESLSVQCTGRTGQTTGLFAVAGAKWRPVKNELQLTSAQSAWRVDPVAQKLVVAGVSNVACARFPEREAMMRRLQQAPR